jgi:hypothetical protein
LTAQFVISAFFFHTAFAGLKLGDWDILGQPWTSTVGREMGFGIEWPYPWFYDGVSIANR